MIHNEHVQTDVYKYDPSLAFIFSALIDRHDLPDINCNAITKLVRHRRRNPQTSALLNTLASALIPCNHLEWLAKRNIQDASQIFSLDFEKLDRQNLLDLYILPDDYILDEYGEKPVIGPIFPDFRDGKLVGICIRNISPDKEYVSSAKYTFSNFGWFLDGYDLYQPDIPVFLVEGVFDAFAMRKMGYPAIALGTASPHPMQLACIKAKFKDVAICFDNDFWGRHGAYTTSRILKAPVCQIQEKDVAVIYEKGDQFQPSWLKLSELRELLVAEIHDYNALISRGEVLRRPLPYN